MIRKFRFLMVFTVLAALLALVVPSFAQEQTFGLSSEDFALLTSANGQSVNFNSLAFDILVDLAVSGDPSSTVNVKINGTGALDAALGSLQLALTGTADAQGTSTPINFELRVVENVIYINPGDGSGWQGMAVDDAVDQLSSMGSMFGVDPMALASGDASSDPAAMQSMNQAMTALSNINPADYISMSRVGDSTVMDMGATQFSIAFDLGKFFSSDAFSQLISAGMQMSGQTDSSGMDPASMGMMAGMLFQGARFSFDQHIGKTDNLVHRGTLNFSMNVNPAMMGSSGTNAQPVAINLTMDINNIRYNTPVIVEVPADVQMMSSGS